MASKFTHGVRVVASDGHDTGFVQTGFTPAQAAAEASRLTARDDLANGTTYEAARVGK